MTRKHDEVGSKVSEEESIEKRRRQAANDVEEAFSWLLNDARRRCCDDDDDARLNNWVLSQSIPPREIPAKDIKAPPDPAPSYPILTKQLDLLLRECSPLISSYGPAEQREVATWFKFALRRPRMPTLLLADILESWNMHDTVKFWRSIGEEDGERPVAHAPENPNKTPSQSEEADVVNKRKRLLSKLATAIKRLRQTGNEDLFGANLRIGCNIAGVDWQFALEMGYDEKRDPCIAAQAILDAAEPGTKNDDQRLTEKTLENSEEDTKSSTEEEDERVWQMKLAIARAIEEFKSTDDPGDLWKRITDICWDLAVSDEVVMQHATSPDMDVYEAAEEILISAIEDTGKIYNDEEMPKPSSIDGEKVDREGHGQTRSGVQTRRLVSEDPSRQPIYEKDQGDHTQYSSSENTEIRNPFDGQTPENPEYRTLKPKPTTNDVELVTPSIESPQTMSIDNPSPRLISPPKVIMKPLDEPDTDMPTPKKTVRTPMEPPPLPDNDRTDSMWGIDMPVRQAQGIARELRLDPHNYGAGSHSRSLFRSRSRPRNSNLMHEASRDRSTNPANETGDQRPMSRAPEADMSRRRYRSIAPRPTIERSPSASLETPSPERRRLRFLEAMTNIVGGNNQYTLLENLKSWSNNSCDASGTVPFDGEDFDETMGTVAAELQNGVRREEIAMPKQGKDAEAANLLLRMQNRVKEKVKDKEAPFLLLKHPCQIPWTAYGKATLEEQSRRSEEARKMMKDDRLQFPMPPAEAVTQLSRQTTLEDSSHDSVEEYLLSYLGPKAAQKSLPLPLPLPLPTACCVPSNCYAITTDRKRVHSESFETSSTKKPKPSKNPRPFQDPTSSAWFSTPGDSPSWTPETGTPSFTRAASSSEAEETVFYKEKPPEQPERSLPTPNLSSIWQASLLPEKETRKVYRDTRLPETRRRDCIISVSS